MLSAVMLALQLLAPCFDVYEFNGPTTTLVCPDGAEVNLPTTAELTDYLRTSDRAYRMSDACIRDARAAHLSPDMECEAWEDEPAPCEQF